MSGRGASSGGTNGGAKHRIFFLWIVLGWLLLAQTAFAQAGMDARLTALQSDRFPHIITFLDVHDAAGNFVSGIAPQDFVVIENGREITPDNLQELRPGAQFVVAINPGPPFAIRDGQGMSRFAYMQQPLRTWASAAAADDLDDLSLLTTGDVESTHLPDKAAWLSTFDTYEPDLKTALSSLDVLSRALDVAADVPPRPGMGRGVLFITSPPDRSGETALQNLGARASQAGVRVFVWMVASQNLFESSGAAALQELARQTGGSYFAFSGTESLPDVEMYLEPIRQTYRLAYNSQINATGTHELAVRVNRGSEPVSTAVRTFDMEVAPPNPVFVSPPAQITRQGLGSDEDLKENLSPRTQNLEILIEFPDGHPRSLVRTVLYVNGVVLAENTSPPFDQFTWDLTEYTAIGRHTLQVEAVDVLGLRGVSIETPVQITVERPRQDALMVISRNGTALAAAAILMAGAVLVFVLIIGGRIRPRPRVPANRRGRAAAGKTRPVASRSPTRPVRQRAVGKLAARPTSRASSAYLVKLVEGRAAPRRADKIELSGLDISLGSDASRSSLVFKDPSVDPIHACIRHDGNGLFQLQDQGSVAGTWLNFAPLSQTWTDLQDGDLIHLGRVGFRFKMARPTVRRTKISFVDPAR